MTSDQGLSAKNNQLTSHDAPVTPPTPGLNPNANIFHSSKSSSKSASPTSRWPDEDSKEDTNTENVIGNLMNLSYPAVSMSPDVLLNGNGAGSSDSGYLASPNDPASSIDETSSIEDRFESVDDDMKALLKHQLEYYFSRENLAVDSYLVSQMDGDQYVPISIIASFNQVKRLTNDHDLIVQVLRGSTHVQVDQKGEKVRPLHKRCVVILREIPDSTPKEEVEKLFSGENCPQFSSCEFAHNNCWNVTFETEHSAQRAYQYLREEVQSFKGHPIMARIKAKPIVLNSYVPKNGFKGVQQQPPNLAFDPINTSFNQAPRRFPPSPAFTQVPQNNLHFLNGNQTFPFYQPAANVLQAAAAAACWGHNLVPPNSAPPFFDAGMAFAVNGFQAQGFKFNNMGNRFNYSNLHASKIHARTLSNPDGIAGLMHERHFSHGSFPNGMRSPRTSDFPKDNIHQNGHLPQNVLESLVLHHATHHQHNNAHNFNHKQENVPPRYRRMRRRRDEDGASISQSSPSTPPDIGQEFELDVDCFPALPGAPGASTSTTTGEVFENKLSDVVKGTAKVNLSKSPSPQTHQPPSTDSANNMTPVAKESANRINNNHLAMNNNIVNKEKSDEREKSNTVLRTLVPPVSPLKISKATSTSDVSSDPQPSASSDTLPTDEISDQRLESGCQSTKLSYAQMALLARKRAEKDAETKVKVTDCTTADELDEQSESEKQSLHQDRDRLTEVEDKESSDKEQWIKNGRRCREGRRERRPGQGQGQHHELQHEPRTATR